MNNFAGVLRVFALGTALGAFAVAGGATEETKAQLKMYQETLESLKGQENPPIMAKLGEWKFARLESWEEENPTSEAVKKHDRGKIKFSKQELKDIFGAEGKYRVDLFTKVVGKDWATTGQITDLGETASKDREIQVELLCVVRIVYKNNLMVHYRIWPRLDQMAISRGLRR
jgi:hypothetical protein